MSSMLLAVAGTTPEPSSISPGVLGFLATFGLVLACILLFVSMVRRLRRMQYRAEHDELDDPTPVEPVEDEQDQRETEPDGPETGPKSGGQP